MRHATSLLALAILATSTRVQAQAPSNPNQRIPVQRPIAGTVVDEQGQPVPGARLWWGGGTGFKEFKADQQGRFEALSPIEWKLLEGPTMLGSLWTEADGFSIQVVSVLGGDEQTRPELELKVKLHDYSAALPSRLRVVDQNGTPVAQALIEASPTNGGFSAPFSCLPGRTDGEGHFKFERMPLSGPALRVTTADAGVQDFRLMSSNGAPKTRVLKLRPTGKLEGRIVGPAESRRGLQITLQSAETPRSEDPSLISGVRPEFTVADVELDGDGRFIVPAFIAGKIRLEVKPPSDGIYIPEVPREVEVTAGATTIVEIPMARGIPVSGRVIEGLTNAPLPGVAVTVSSFSVSRKIGGRIETRTDRDGRFRAIALPGRASAQAYSSGSEEAGYYMPPSPVGGPSLEIKPDDKEKEFSEIRLTAARRIIGRLVSPGRPVGSMRVAADNLPPSAPCDADGYFLLTLPLDYKPKKYVFGDWGGGTKPEARLLSTSPLVLEMPENFTF